VRVNENNIIMPACLALGNNSTNNSAPRAHRRTKDAVVRAVVAVILSVLAVAAIGRAATLGRSSDPVVLSPSSSSSSAEQLHEESILLDLLLQEGRRRPDVNGTTSTTATATTTGAEAARGRGVLALAAAKTARDENKTTTTTTLALLYPPGLQGGYRNQVLRMVALCHHALVHNRTLYLPSLWWSTQRKWRRTKQSMGADLSSNGTNGGTADMNDVSVWYPVPMDLIFDIEHWNRYALKNPESLPLLVESLPPRRNENSADRPGDCWSTAAHQGGQSSGDADYLQRALELRGHLVPVSNWTRKLVRWPPSPLDDKASDGYNPRQHDLLRLVEHCTRPFVHGGGRMAGRLWNEYLGLHQEVSTARKKNKNKDINEGVYESVLRALQPREKWRRVGIEHCLRSPSSNVEDSGGDNNYAAVHARIEPEMMAHPCGRNMERNLTVILDHVARLLLKNQSSTSTTSTMSVVVAVSREGLVDPRFPQFLELSRANLHTLNEYTGGTAVKEDDADEDEIRNDRQPLMKRKLLHGQFPVVECGGEMMARYYRSLASGSSNPDRIGDHNTYGTLLEQVINFDVAVQAKVFVGVELSSYSNAIWTTRFLLNKGANYKYTTSGIEPVVGMPPPHSNCPRGSAALAATRKNRRRPK
jgi:hypothetical protein